MPTNGNPEIASKSNALEHRQIAANQGHVDAQCAYWIMMDKGLGNYKDQIIALKELITIAVTGHGNAQYYLETLLTPNCQFPN